jgi:hypothetical protein
MLSCAVTFAILSMLSKNAEPRPWTQSIYLTDQEHMLNCAVAFANLSIFSKNVKPQAILLGN